MQQYLDVGDDRVQPDRGRVADLLPAVGEQAAGQVRGALGGTQDLGHFALHRVLFPKLQLHHG